MKAATALSAARYTASQQRQILNSMERYVGRVSQEADREKNKFETEETETDDNLSDRVTQINNETRLKASLKEKQSSGSQALIPSSQALIPSSTSTTETLTPAILTALLTELASLRAAAPPAAQPVLPSPACPQPVQMAPSTAPPTSSAPAPDNRSSLTTVPHDSACPQEGCLLLGCTHTGETDPAATAGSAPPA